MYTDCSKGTGEEQAKEEEDTIYKGEGGGDHPWEAMEGQLASLGSDLQPAGE